MNTKNILIASLAIIISTLIFTLALTNNFGNKTGVVTVKAQQKDMLLLTRLCGI